MFQMAFIVRGAVLVLLLAVAVIGHAAAPAELKPEMQEFVQEMVERHGFERRPLERALRLSRFQSAIIRAMDAPSTALPWHKFRARYIDDTRITGGLRFWEKHAQVIERAAAEFQVDPDLIVATIGIETLFGRHTGTFNVFDALVTLAFSYPSRAAYFRGELEQFLLLSRETGLSLTGVKGSYAGAVGVPQFMPSSYRKYAVDFDGDGRRDLRGAVDAIGSVANYYRHFGWKSGTAVVVEVEVDESEIDALLAAGIKPHMTVAEYRKRGVVPQELVADDAKAALFMVETGDGPRYFLGLNNFYVITRYNRSINYAMVVRELADTLRQRRAAATAAQ